MAVVSKMNTDVLITFTLSGKTLDALFGRKLTDAEMRHFNTADVSRYFSGCESVRAPIVETLHRMMDDANEEKVCDEEGALVEGEAWLEIKNDPNHPDQYTTYWDNETEHLTVQPISDISQVPSKVAERKKAEFKKDAEEMLARELNGIEPKSWADIPLNTVLSIINEKQMDGHTLRTVKSWGEYAGCVLRRAEIHRDTNFMMDNQPYEESAWLFHTPLADGTTATLRINKPKVMADDLSVLYDMARAHGVEYDNSCFGRGATARNIIDAIKKAVMA